MPARAWGNYLLDAVNAGYFGDGSDGDVTIVGTITLVRAMFYRNLIVPAGTTLVTAGYPVFVSGVALVDGTVSRNGNGGDGTTGAGGAALASNVLMGSSAGANGATGVGAAGTTPDANRQYGGNGGAGGSGNGGANAGGAGGTGALTASFVQPSRVLPFLLSGFAFGGSNAGSGNAPAMLVGSGAGGGAGGGDGVNKGGPGGSGGGQQVIVAKTIAGGGVISADGGAGGSPSAGNCGSGGGGGGGVVVVGARNLNVSALTIRAAGGAPGVKTGTGVNGVAGSAGLVLVGNL